MLFSKNVSGQSKRFLSVFAKRFFLTKSFNFSLINKTAKLNKLSFTSSLGSKSFSTNNNISEKESIELIEAGVFEVLKSAQKLKHDKLNRTATMEELGKNDSFAVN